VDDEQILALLAGIEPSDAIPIPPGFRAVPVGAAVDAGGDPDALEAWVKSRSGWTKRMPAQFMAPDATALDALFYVLPGKALEGGPPPVPPSLPTSDLVAFVATTNLAVARTFYEKALGLKVTGESPIAITFDANATTLRIVAVPKVTVAPYTAIGWSVTDIAKTVRELIGRGVKFENFDGVDQDELGVWKSPGGAQVAWFKDPDGNTLSLTQF
jgi:catechol 2,3-dioxygenase-like lactoylglutathione lyase family enzyme